MKKIAVLLPILVIVTLGAFAVFAETPAVVTKDTSCNLFDAEGNLFSTTDSQAVWTNSNNGNSKITCHAQLLEGWLHPEKTVHWDFESTSLLCNTGAGSTEDWKAVVTPSGEVMLTCHYKV